MRLPRLRAAAFPALGIVAIPKCPLCVMIVFGALGLGHPLHDVVFTALQAAVLLGVTVYLVTRYRRIPLPLLALGLAGAACVLLRMGGLVPPAFAYAGTVAIAAAVVFTPKAAQACGCAPAEALHD